MTQREGVLEAQLADKAERLGALEKREADLLSQLMEAEKGAVALLGKVDTLSSEVRRTKHANLVLMTTRLELRKLAQRISMRLNITELEATVGMEMSGVLMKEETISEKQLQDYEAEIAKLRAISDKMMQDEVAWLERGHGGSDTTR